MEKKLWYAIMQDNEDTDWGIGSFDREEAIAKAKSWKNNGSPDAYIAVIDANYDDNGEPTTDGECVEEIRDFE